MLALVLSYAHEATMSMPPAEACAIIPQLDTVSTHKEPSDKELHRFARKRRRPARPDDGQSLVRAVSETLTFSITWKNPGVTPKGEREASTPGFAPVISGVMGTFSAPFS